MGHKNILTIIADDLGAAYIGAYGSKTVTTPSLDKFATQGVRFSMAFASTASCSGSRSTIYTGLHTHQNGGQSFSTTCQPTGEAGLKLNRTVRSEQHSHPFSDLRVCRHPA